jgi:predicted dehydrogenase
MNDTPADPSSRRDFLASAAAAALTASALSACAASDTSATHAGGPAHGGGLFRAPAIPRVRIGYVGVGLQGSSHVSNLLKVPGCEIAAVCDIVPEKVERIQKQVEAAGFKKPKGFSSGPHDFERLCQEDLDLVYTATPWEFHVPVCLAAMKNGKHAATEVPMGYRTEELWELVETSEKLAKHCVMMENCCYGQTELAILHMVRKGVFGELIHGQGGYLHDLRGIKFENANEGLWRRAHSRERNGNLYPTHGLGPVAQCMNINRGDRFDWMVSMSSKTRGLELFGKAHFPDGDPRRAEKFRNGDVNSSLIRTASGCTIYVGHNCDSGRPYSRINLVQGTKAIASGYPDRIYIEGVSPEDQWEDMSKYFPEWDHPLWKREEERSKGAGHGGMDFLEDLRLVECLNKGEPLDQDVYDGTAWSVIGPLSERSVAENGKPQDVPDFTRGAWKTRPALGIVGS